MQNGAVPFPATQCIEVLMQIDITKPLFAWDCLQESPGLATIKPFLASVPDARLLDMLRQYRGCGRNDYPVGVSWGVVLLRPVGATRELRRDCTRRPGGHTAPGAGLTSPPFAPGRARHTFLFM